jgi:fatty-acyl-CoA synthase
MTTYSANPYDQDLDKNTANYTPLSPLTWIERAAAVYPSRASVIHGDIKYTWQETFSRCRKLSSALFRHGIKTGDAVAVLATNIPAFYECLFGIPAAGAIINPINIRLDSEAIAFILDHGEAKILITDTEFSDVVKAALTKCKNKPYVIDISDSEALSHKKIGEIEYEDFLKTGDPKAPWTLPKDEWQAMALCYTSGTTGNPKGVVYHHRGAYLNAIGCSTAWNMTHHPIYLWTLPMFHCCGWTFPWTIAALGGTNICLRRIAAKNIYDSIEQHGVTHFCGAPIVLNFIVNADPKDKKPLPHKVEVMTAGAAPPSAVLKATEKAGFHITHTYGLTETYGPAVFNAPQDEWAALNDDEYAETLTRQGVRYPVLQDLDVMDPETMVPVPRDGKTIGEIMFKGNVVMRGYLKNPSATEESLRGGYFHSGDLAVMHPDGYLQIKDRSKDIIISGGENISSIEVEDLLYKHPSILEAAVVARPDDKWGETPCAFVTLKATAEKTTEEDIINYCKEKIAKFKLPKTVIFRELPKTSTGKIQKFKLRMQAKDLGSL